MSNGPPAPAQTGGVDLNTIMPFLLLLSPLLEMQNPGMGVGMASGVMQFQQAQSNKRRQESQALLGLLAEVDDDQLETTIGALLDAGLYDPKTVRAMAKASRAFVDPTRRTERKLKELVTGMLGGQEVTLPRGEFEREKARGGLETQQFQRTQSAQLTGEVRRALFDLSQNPDAQVRARATVLSRRLAAGEDPSAIMAEASDVAGQAGATAASTAQKPARQDFLRANLVASLAGTQKVDLATLRKQMDAEGMVWGAELIAVRKALQQPQSESMVTIKDPISGQTVTVRASSLPSFFPRRAPGGAGDGDGAGGVGAPLGAGGQPDVRPIRNKKGVITHYAINGRQVTVAQADAEAQRRILAGEDRSLAVMLGWSRQRIEKLKGRATGQAAETAMARANLRKVEDVMEDVGAQLAVAGPAEKLKLTRRLQSLTIRRRQLINRLPGPAAGPSAQPTAGAPAAKTMTRAELRAIAAQHKISESEAERQAKAQGFTILP